MNDKVTMIRVGIADMKIARGETLIRTAGLGSCVGVVLYDATRQIAGMVHIMLPSSKLARGNLVNKYKYADTAVSDLIRQLENIGVPSRVLLAKIAGGAQMFQFTGANDLMRIGPRNVEAIKAELSKFGIKITGEDVGGNSGRTIEFNPATSILRIKTVNKENKFI